MILLLGKSLTNQCLQAVARAGWLELSRIADTCKAAGAPGKAERTGNCNSSMTQAQLNGGLKDGDANRQAHCDLQAWADI